jgi:hypothetical protein
VWRGWATELLETLPSLEWRHVPDATTCSGWTTQRHAGWRTRVELIGFCETAPEIVAVVLRSNAAGPIRFLMNPCHHDFITQRQKLDVAAQTDSSGPKRLLPQLQTKVPTIRTWGKKMAVVIDEAFFGSLVGLEREKHLSNSEIAWFVVGYDPKPGGWTLIPREVVFTKLDASVKSLTAGVPLSKERFEEQLREKLKTTAPSHPLAGIK